MKRIVGIALTLALLMSLCACGGLVSIMPGTTVEAPDAPDTAPADPDAFAERPLLAFLGRESFGASYYDDTPAALSYQPELEDGTRGCRSYVFDRAAIITACDALRGITVTARTDEAPVSRAEYILTAADGTAYDFTFGVLADGARVLCADSGDYLITGGDALWDIAFPAYSADFDVFDLYFSADVRAFADHFEEDRPVSVGYRLGSGAAITTEDPDAVEQAFRALENASVIVVEDQPDLNVDVTQVRAYVFTMADGTSYTFEFAQRCLAVTANADFGPVYYWLDGTDALWNVPILPAGESAGFEGGAVSSLREDIRAAVAAADGEEAQTIVGVFVEYDIDGESGYLTLDGDTASDFVRRVGAVAASAETAEAPEGDTVTVSVTLSDSTGPIIYFTGDTVQQRVGTNYVCDGGDMDALRAAVLALAAEGHNTAEVQEGGTE